MRSPLVRFLLVLVLLLIGLELFVRANGKYFYALSDKMLLKEKILEREPDTRVLFLGTSRFLDAIDHHLFTDELEALTGEKFISLNAATTGLQSERLAYFAKVAAENKGLTHIVIEASPPAMGKGKLGLPGLEEDGEEEVLPDNFADRFEKRLQQSTVQHLALAKYRKALRPKTIIKLMVLYTANVMDPNIWSRKRPLEAIFMPKNEKIEPNMLTSLAPQVISPGEDTVDAFPDTEQFANLNKVAQIFKDSDKTIIWVAPPVSKPAVAGSHNAKLSGYYQFIANQYGDSVFDYAGLGFDDAYLRDPSHLNSRGRSVFSKILAAHLSHYFKSESVAD